MRSAVQRLYAGCMGDHTTTRNSFPGGSIISEYFILTAGHCVWKQDGTLMSKNDMKVHAGDHDSR